MRDHASAAPFWPRRLPLIDAGGAIVVGALMLALRQFLAPFYGLPLSLVTFIAIVNVVYATPGLILTARREKPRWLLSLLIAANLVWFGVCLVLASQLWSSARVFGLVQILGEGVYVAVLALLEWKHRDAILADESASGSA